MSEVPVEVISGPGELAQRAAEELLHHARQACAERGVFRVALAGGSTPRTTYALLPELAAAEDFERWHLYWGDERCVPPDHEDSNYRMVREAWLDRIALPPGHVHRVPTEAGSPQEVAAAYENELRRSFPADPFPRFDLVLLGLGEDGHTASLFPGSPTLGEARSWVAAHLIPGTSNARITLTFPVINAARAVRFLVSGTSKSRTLLRVLAGETLPASLVAPANGSLRWLVDEAAAADSADHIDSGPG